jgi:hypothetical protein
VVGRERVVNERRRFPTGAEIDAKNDLQRKALENQL